MYDSYLSILFGRNFIVHWKDTCYSAPTFKLFDIHLSVLYVILEEITGKFVLKWLNDSNNLTPNFCYYSWPSNFDFLRLNGKCLPQVPRSNRCADCQTQIQTVTHFKDHIREHVQDEHPTACIICRQVLRNDAQIDTHAKYHLQFSDDTIGSDRQCNICQQVH